MNGLADDNERQRQAIDQARNAISQLDPDLDQAAIREQNAAIRKAEDAIGANNKKRQEYIGENKRLAYERDNLAAPVKPKPVPTYTSPVQSDTAPPVGAKGGKNNAVGTLSKYEETLNRLKHLK